MDIDSAGNFLVGSILYGFGFSALTIAVVFINNVFHKYWKPVTLFSFPKVFDHPNADARFATPEELQKIPPTMNPETPNQTKKD